MASRFSGLASSEQVDVIMKPPPLPQRSIAFWQYSSTSRTVPAQDRLRPRHVRLSKVAEHLPLGEIEKVLKARVPGALEEGAGCPAHLHEGQDDLLEGGPVEDLELRQRHETVRASVKGYEDPLVPGIDDGRR